jgi:phosphatidylserine/phosphatidylglycerophosphate/cardiolipin synthase-like enzyme
MAELLAPKLRDRGLFKKQLEYVLNAKLNVIGGMAPEHKVEQEKARRLLADIEHIFPPLQDARPPAPRQKSWFFDAPDTVDRSGALAGHKLRLVRTGEEMDSERWRLTRQAKRSLYIKAFAWKNDNVGLALVDAVCKRIRETGGKLEVKIIVENFGSKELMDGTKKQILEADRLLSSGPLRRGALQLQKCGASIVFYKPRREDWTHLMQVRHEKLFVVDGKVMLTGGSNIGDHYHMASPRSGKWYDLDVHVEGPIACWYHNQFQKSWRRVVSQDMGIEFQGLTQGRASTPFSDARRDKIYGLSRMARCDMSATQTRGPSHMYGIIGRPMNGPQRPILDSYISAIKAAKNNIRLYAPYFVPAYAFTQALMGAAKRGVKVVVITNSPESLDEDNLIFSAMLLSVYHEFEGKEFEHSGSLIGSGVEIRVWTRKATLHRKGGVFDAGDLKHQKMFLGSDNLDVRGQEYSTESIVWTDDAKLVAELTHDILEDFKSSRPLTEEYRQKYLAQERSNFMGRMKLWIAESFRNMF